MGMKITESDLFPTENILITKAANLMIKPSEEGLSRFAFNQLIGDNEALGGKAYLTNYRIIFKSHGFNRMVGKCSVFLPNIVHIQKKLTKIAVESRVQKFKFVMWTNTQFVTDALKLRDEMGAEEIDQLRELVTAHPDRIGTLQKQETLEAVNKVLAGITTITDAVSGFARLDKSAFAEVVSLFADTTGTE